MAAGQQSSLPGRSANGEQGQSRFRFKTVGEKQNLLCLKLLAIFLMDYPLKESGHKL